MPGGIGAVAINMFNTTRTDDPNAIVAFSSGSLLNMVTGKYGEWGAEDVKFTATAGAGPTRWKGAPPRSSCSAPMSVR